MTWRTTSRAPAARHRRKGFRHHTPYTLPVYLRAKYIKGSGPYWYLARTERTGDKVRQIHIRYVGKVTPADRKPLEGVVEDPAPPPVKPLPFIDEPPPAPVFDGRFGKLE